MDYAEDAVGTNEFPRPNRRAAFSRILWQLPRIDRRDRAVRERSAGSPAIHFGLISVNTFLVFRRKAGRGGTWGTGARTVSVPGHDLRSVEIARVSDVVIHPGERWATAGDDRGQAGK